ncbi:MAG: RNA polymerase factor sigma-54 [Methyloligellaceae bacterium]
MALTAKLELRQSQSLVMTPQLQQAIKLLQLSNLELTAFVETELERNPLLEHAEANAEPVAGEAAPQAEQEDTETAGNETSSDDDFLDLDDGEAAGDPTRALDTEVDNVFPDASEPQPGLSNDSSWASLRTGSTMRSDGDVNLEAFVAEEVGLRDHLTDQLNLALADPAKRLVGHHLVDMVDEAGYLRGELEGLAERLGAPMALVEETLEVLQTFDPPGVFARDIRECLALQLKDKDRLDPAMQALLANLDLMAAHEFPALKRACGIDDEDLAEMICEIKALNPKPGLKFGHIAVQPVVPDVLVRLRPDGIWHVELNSDTLPKVLVNQTYYATVNKTAKSDQDKSYLNDCLQTANWLVKSLDQRARTILKVAQEIVRQQDTFLTRGVQYLRPLNLKTVADAIGMHESTVSRVTTNKYMATSRGIFELKYFFTSAIPASGSGDAHSSEAVRYRIKQLIDNESPAKVLSDDKIVTLLRGDGIDIARRTVAKYREAMRIPSSVQRRREKKLALQT